MAVYLYLFNGRPTPDTELDDWGSEGPCIGPFDYVQQTYACHIKCGLGDSITDIPIVGELVEYEGVFYGDFTISDTELRPRR
jgi:hypothetical protein